MGTAATRGAGTPRRACGREHPENTVSMIEEAPDGILFEGVERDEDGKPEEFIGRLLDRRASRFIVRYWVRAPKHMTPSRRDKWIDWLMEARIE